MKTIDLRALVLPPTMWAEVLRLLDTIEAADSVAAVDSANHYALGFVLGLETAGQFLASDIEALYIGFEGVSFWTQL